MATELISALRQRQASMAENVSDTKPNTKPKLKYVEGNVTIPTNAFNPNQPELKARAVSAFAEHMGGEQVSNTVVTMLVHKVGESVTYHVTGEVVG